MTREIKHSAQNELRHLLENKQIAKREQTSDWHKKYLTIQNTNKYQASLKNHTWNIP